MNLDPPRILLLKLIADAGSDLKRVSQAIGKNHAYLQQYVKGGKPQVLPEEVREALGHHFNVDPDCFRREGKPQKIGDAPAPRRPDHPPLTNGDLGAGIIEIGKTEFAAIGRFDAAFSAGRGSLLENDPEPIGYELIELQWLHTVSRAAPERLAVVRVDGDSMEDTLRDDDWVLVDLTQRNFSREGLYALRIGDLLRIKRVAMNLSKKLIRVISDNTRYPLDELEEDEVHLVGRVISIIARRLV